MIDSAVFFEDKKALRVGYEMVFSEEYVSGYNVLSIIFSYNLNMKSIITSVEYSSNNIIDNLEVYLRKGSITELDINSINRNILSDWSEIYNFSNGCLNNFLHDKKNIKGSLDWGLNALVDAVKKRVSIGAFLGVDYRLFMPI